MRIVILCKIILMAGLGLHAEAVILYAQPDRASSTMSAVVRQLFDHFELGTANVTEVGRIPNSLQYVVEGLPVRVRLGPEGGVDDVGYLLFKPEEHERLAPVAGFVERYVLQLLMHSPGEQLAMLDGDNVLILLNGIRFGHIGFEDVRGLVDVIERRQSCTLRDADFRLTLECTGGEGRRAVIDMPARIDLIQGLDKGELGEKLWAALTSLEPQQVSSTCEFPEVALIPYRGSIYSTPPEELHPGLRSERFYRREGANYELLRDDQLFWENLTNFIACPAPDNPFAISIVQAMYGSFKELDGVGLSDLIYFLSRDHTMYIGFDRNDEGYVRATVIFKHTYYAYQHMLIIDTIADERRQIVLEASSATLYTHLRSDNVRSMYGQYIDHTGDRIKVGVNR